MKKNTIAIHTGENDLKSSQGSIPDIVMASTFVLEEDVSFSSENFEDNSPYTYTRWSNPTIRILEKKVAALEQTQDAISFSSGMGACTSTLLNFLQSGDRMVVSDICYAGVREFCNTTLAKLRIEVVPVNTTDLKSVESALSIPTKLIFIETPNNPILRLTDIRKISALAKNSKSMLVVDSTFATPMATCPSEFGADLVMHSLTKYMCGHGDSMGGIVAGKKDHIDFLRSRATIHLGNIISPFNAWLINRGIVTLNMRMKAHADHALKLAKWLEQHPEIKQVNYPGLKSHPQHELAKEQMKLFSGMLSFQVKGNAGLIAERMRKQLKIAHYAVSLGHHKTLIFYIPTNDLQDTTFKLDNKNLEAYKAFAGEGVFRVSVGLEDPEDIYEDICRTLK